MSKAYPKTVKTLVELAKLLGVSRQAIYDWKKNPDAPVCPKGKIDVKAWVDFVNIYSPRAITLGDDEAVEDVKDIGLLKIKKLQEEVKKLEIDNATKAGQLMPIPEVVEVFNKFASEWRKVIDNSGLDKIEKDRCFKSLQMATERIGKRLEASQC